MADQAHSKLASLLALKKRLEEMAAYLKLVAEGALPVHHKARPTFTLKGVVSEFIGRRFCTTCRTSSTSCRISSGRRWSRRLQPR
jgi:hypothetical protein